MSIKTKNAILWLIILFNSAIFLLYGFAKLAGFQFSPHAIPPDLLLKDVGPRGIMWYFFSVKKGYAVLVALSEIIPAILILFKRTRFLGAVLYVIVVSNILAINILFVLTPQTLALSILLFVNTWIIIYSERQKIKVLFSK